jgi:hypothetical protein
MFGVTLKTLRQAKAADRSGGAARFGLPNRSSRSVMALQ